ncbi:hypothetical protein NDU88_006359 [Pleurodeles waltl]|uniref:Uncharacterized protein n=1 Tax=Pleurodeles waltl TaxID=8319 RepID=A0AAV7SPD8_PLEWA|nr:hypothetical protein NDU88_006359 [Pleurodeles waltl]
MRMRVFHFNGRIARGTTDCGRSSSTALQTRRSGATPSLSAKVCADQQKWEGVIGRNGDGKSNSSGHLRLETCEAHDLLLCSFSV